jgi:hypothetical protein
VRVRLREERGRARAGREIEIRWDFFIQISYFSHFRIGKDRADFFYFSK